jgi:biotin carboxyl carrier protein
MRKIIIRLAGVAVVLAAAWYAYRFVQRLPQRQEHVPTTQVRRGDVVIRAYTRGELRAVRSVTLTAPNLFGTVQVTKLAPLGSFAREKDLVVEFDESEVLSRLEEKQLELEQIEEQVKKATAELAIRNNQDQVELLRARYSVRRAELEVKRNELLSPIDARRNELNLEEARRRLKQLESDIKSRLEQAEAELAVLREQKNKATIEMSREKQRLTQTKLLAPMSGLVSIQQNRFTGGRMFGMQVPDIREGDQVQPGMPVADVLDLSELEILAKIGELDRANLREGQEATIQLDALSDNKLHGSIKSMSGTASANIFLGDPAKKFDVTFSVDMKQLLSAVGATPDQIQRVMETAARNRSKPQTLMASGAFPGMGVFPGTGGAPGGPPSGGGMPGASGSGSGDGSMAMAAPGAPGGGGDQPGGDRRAGRQQRTGQMSDEQRQKMREALQKELGSRKMEDLSPDERRRLYEKVRGGSQSAGGAGRATGASGARPGVALQPGGPPASGSGGLETVPAIRPFGAQFTEKEMAEAKLPPPPGEGNQLEVLLRPGLLADVEIVVERIRDAIYVPAQAVFEKEGKFVVHVKTANRFEERAVKLLKRSESVMVISEGLKPGEIVALADPTAKKGDKKKEERPEGGPNPVGTAPGGRS